MKPLTPVAPGARVVLGVAFFVVFVAVWALATLGGFVQKTFLADNPKAAQGLANAYFDAVAMIKADPKKSFEIMGADVKQTGEAFEKSQAYLRWQDRAANQKFFSGEHAQFSKEAADLLMEAGIIKTMPDMTKLADTQFIR